MVEKGYKEADDQAYFIDIVETNIRKARFLLMIVGDGIREDVEKMIEFMNASVQMHYQFALCELEIYQLEDGSRLIVPQLTTKTQIITRTLYEISQVEKTLPVPEEIISQPGYENKKNIKPRYRDIEDWANSTKLLHVSAEDMINFANDMEDLGFKMSPGTSDFGIDYKSERYQKTLKFLMLFHDGETGAIQPKSFYSFLEQTDYSKAIADKLLEDLKEHLIPNQKNIPYRRPEGYYFFTFKRLIEHKDEIVQIFETFIRSL